VTNVFWKYHHLESLPLDICEHALTNSFSIIDDFIDTYDLYREAFSLSCQVQHSVFDSMYLVCARRHDGVLITADKKLNQLAQKQSIKTL
jgi:predicted nucleic acid-binding protein